MNASGAVAAAEPRQRTGPRSKGVLTPESSAAPVTVERLWPGEQAAEFVRHYWLPRWTLPVGAALRQDVLEYPTSNLVIEPGEATLYRARRGRSARVLTGTGWAFGVMLHPGAARTLTGLNARTAPTAIPVGGLPLADSDNAVLGIRDRMADGDGQGAIDVFEAWLSAHAPARDADSLLVDAIVDVVEGDRSITRVEQLADRFGLGVRHLQRLISGHVGFSPKWLIQRYRLQEAAAALRSGDVVSLAGLSTELGYADQAHFGREFKSVVGMTPGAYLTEAARMTDGASPRTGAPTVDTDGGS